MVNSDANQPDWAEQLYEVEAANFVLYGRALGLSHAEAEDVLQETFLGLIQLSAVPEEPVPYALRCYRNRALNYKRGLWRRLLRELESRRWFERSPGERPEERKAMRLLAELPAPQREVIVLKIWHRHTFETVGRLLGISPNTAAGRYRYGMEKLKSRLQNSCHETNEPAGDPTAILEAAASLGSS